MATLSCLCARNFSELKPTPLIGNWSQKLHMREILAVQGVRIFIYLIIAEIWRCIFRYFSPSVIVLESELIHLVFSNVSY